MEGGKVHACLCRGFSSIGEAKVAEYRERSKGEGEGGRGRAVSI